MLCKVCGKRSADMRPDFHWNKPVMQQVWELQGDIKKELTMTKGLVVSLAVLALSTSAALAANRTHHRDATNAFAAMPTPPVGWMGGVISSDHALHLLNLHDSGYNPKNDFNAAGNVADQ
jgi:hypothetical protein